jgi:3-oxoacyl-[acyl-carrier protein] reductase
MKKLVGKVALVTGGAQGIGKKICERFAAEGALIAVCDFNLEVSKITAGELSSLTEADAFFVNVADENTVDKCIGEVITKFGKIDILVNNAGIRRDNIILKMKKDEWDSVISVNLTGAFNVSKAAIRFMLKARTGTIINISSVVGLRGNIGQANYSASKAGLIGLTKTMAKEFSSRNITVNAIAPGFIMTEMTDNLSDEVKKGFLEDIPLKRAGTPEDIANVAAFLASADASYLTGQVICVDGGMVM